MVVRDCSVVLAKGGKAVVTVGENGIWFGRRSHTLPTGSKLLLCTLGAGKRTVNYQSRASFDPSLTFRKMLEALELW